MKKTFSLFGCLVALACGIYLEITLPSLLWWNLVLWFFAASTAGIAYFYKIIRLRFATALLLACIAGSLATSIRQKYFENCHEKLVGEYFYIIGDITDTQEIVHPIFTKIYTIAARIGKRVEAAHTEKITGSLLVYVKNLHATDIGDKILLRWPTIKPLQGTRLEFAQFLAKQGIIASLFIYNTHNIRLLEKSDWSLSRWIWNLRQRIYTTILKKLSSHTRPYIGLLFFGNKQHIQTPALQKNFNTWGLSHYLARSGLHIVFLIGLWFFLLRLLPLHLVIKKGLLLIFTIIYAALSWDSISFFRALLVFVLAQGGIFLKREVTSLHLLTLVCMVVLLHNPLQLFYLDFQLTFGLTFGLLIFGKHLR